VQPRQFAAATRRVLIPYTTVWALKARPSVVSSRGFKKMKFVSEQRCLAFSMGTVMGGKDCKKWFPTLAILSTKAINLSPLSVDESTRKLRSATPDLPTDTSSLESPQETSRYRVAEAGVSLVYLGIGDHTRVLALKMSASPASSGPPPLPTGAAPPFAAQAQGYPKTPPIAGQPMYASKMAQGMPGDRQQHAQGQQCTQGQQHAPRDSNTDSSSRERLHQA
jgi:hypothetical protein